MCATVQKPSRNATPFSWVGNRCGANPVNNADRAGTHTVAPLYACSNTTPDAANASNVGVSK